MEVDTQSYDWANDTFVALNDHAMTDKWPSYSNAPHFSQPAFTIPPALLSAGSIERFGQVTPPEEMSPADPRRDSARETSIPVEELKNEALFPDHQLQALQDYQAPPQQPSPQTTPVQDQGPAPKRRRTSRQQPASHVPKDPSPADTQPEAAPQPPKRKRGRPKSQPQMVEAYNADGLPFQVSSARQSHLEKNRVAAHKCRMRKKDYINGLEERARVFTTKNKALKENVAMLREEVLELKNEVLRHAGCGFWAVDEYLARCAGDLLGVKPPSGTPGSSSMQTPTLATSALLPDTMHRSSSAGSIPTASEPSEHDDYGGFDMLEDMDDDINLSKDA